MRGGRSSLNAFTERDIGKIVGGMVENRSRTKIEKRRHVRNTRAAEWKEHRPKRSHVSKNGAAIRMSDTLCYLKMSLVWHSLRFFLFIQLFVVGPQLFVDHVPTFTLVPFLLNRLTFDEFSKYYVSATIVVWNLFKHTWNITK